MIQMEMLRSHVHGLLGCKRLPYEVGIKTDIQTIMTECEADLKGDLLVEAVYYIGLEAWVLIAVIVLVLVDEQLKLATAVHVHASLLGILQLGVEIPCVLATHTVASSILADVIHKRHIGRMTVLELAIHPTC